MKRLPAGHLELDDLGHRDPVDALFHRPTHLGAPRWPVHGFTSRSARPTVSLATGEGGVARSSSVAPSASGAPPSVGAPSGALTYRGRYSSTVVPWPGSVRIEQWPPER